MWSVHRQIDTRVRNAVTLVWGSLRLAPMIWGGLVIWMGLMATLVDRV